jgi:hypothetical protein
MGLRGYTSVFTGRSLFLLVILFVGSCSDDREGGHLTELPVTTLPGVYSGVFPCEGCAGIPTTLWLRADGRFFIEQKYPEVDDRDAMNAYNLGRWLWVTEDRTLVLQGAGPRRTFRRPGPDSLIMRTASDLEHRLDRDPAAPDFIAAIRMAGMMRMVGDGAEFTECLTGLVAPVATRGDFARFLHQYRSAGGRGEPTYVEFDGRFSWSDDGALRSLTIERFVTVKAGGSC